MGNNIVSIAETAAIDISTIAKHKERNIVHTDEAVNADPSTYTKHQKTFPSECPMHNTGNVSECPVQLERDEVNPLNMMPSGNQNPSPGQPFPLSTERQLSSIPKAIVKQGETPFWEYPSAQMFWNAMLRKGWKWKPDDLSPTDMESIIKIHNMNNERAWQEILKWERSLHGKECYNPKLKSFGGKATDYSPKAMMNWLLGSGLPFDRHDWIVDRCGKDVKYIIDYYSSSKDPNKLPYAILDVRLALNSWENLWDRLKVSWWRMVYSKD